VLKDGITAERIGMHILAQEKLIEIIERAKKAN